MTTAATNTLVGSGDAIDRETISIVIRRIGTFALLVMLFNTLDRINVGFAALTMNRDLGIDPRVFGWGLGLFFVTYIPAQIPMTWLGQRLGPHRALPVLMSAWGLCAGLMGAVEGPRSFFALRLLLGVTESAAAPLILYLQSQWIPQRNVGRYSLVTALALPGSFIVGAPLSGWLMTSMHHLGSLPGWRWMFFIEGAATMLFGAVAFWWLPVAPNTAGWLTMDQRSWLISTLRRDNRAEPTRTPAAGRLAHLAKTLRSRRIWIFAACFFSSTVGFYTLLFWLPQLVQELLHGASTMRVTLVSVLPWIGVVAGVLVTGWHSDRKNERYLHVAAAALLGTLGMAGVAASGGWPTGAVCSLVVGAFGIGAAQIVFWTIPMGELRGAPHAATAFAFVNLMGNLAGLLGAPLVGYLRSATHSFGAAIMVVAVFLLIEVALLLALRGQTSCAVNG
jgi:ACS family tartrate transporter-like MFS transporter